MKKVLLLFLVICILNLSGCVVMQEMQEGYDNAVEYAKEFVDEFTKGNFEQAKIYLHPTSSPNKDRLESVVSKLEEMYGVDFNQELETKNVVWKGIAYYDNAFEGKFYDFQFEILIGEKMVNMFFVVVDNNIGYGIFYFGIVE